MKIILRRTGADVVLVPSKELLIVNPDLTQTGQIHAIRSAGIDEDADVVRDWVQGAEPERGSPRGYGWKQRGFVVIRFAAVCAGVVTASAVPFSPWLGSLLTCVGAASTSSAKPQDSTQQLLDGG